MSSTAFVLHEDEEVEHLKSTTRAVFSVENGKASTAAGHRFSAVAVAGELAAADE